MEVTFDDKKLELPVIYFHPGETLEEKLQEMGFSYSEFSKISGLAEDKIKRLTACKMDIDAEIAEILYKSTKIPASMWLKMQESFNLYKLQKLADMLLKNLKRHETAYEVKRQKVRQTINKMAALV